MKLFDVYPLFPIEPVKATGSWLWDSEEKKYLDLYGGHAVISIGHNHPHFVEALKNQLDKISFYSNSVKNSLQEKLADKLGSTFGLSQITNCFCAIWRRSKRERAQACFLCNRKKKNHRV
jgi:acetylornithine/N-succinyldiaminopimelate aminotransferase